VIESKNLEKIECNGNEINKISIKAEKIKILSLNSNNSTEIFVNQSNNSIITINTINTDNVSNENWLKINCPELKILEAHHNKITKIDLTNCVKLDRLNLEQNQISDINNIHISQISKKMKKMHMLNNPCFNITNYVKWLNSIFISDSGILEIETCSVCMNELYEKSIIFECEHCFCFCCMVLWREKKIKSYELFCCPMCRHIITDDEWFKIEKEYEKTYINE
jgi:hypothetical protein